MGEGRAGGAVSEAKDLLRGTFLAGRVPPGKRSMARARRRSRWYFSGGGHLRLGYGDVL